MKKRHLLSGVMALLVSVALSACGGDKNAGGTSAGETKQEASAEETSNTLSEGTPVPGGSVVFGMTQDLAVLTPTQRRTQELETWFSICTKGL